ncbi:MAG: homocysteine S-methyltransferase family protein [Oscillospiraceae bacterium]|nr:homocysteine S-methyltransferase family protein [Oscillospiraceae bacterium]
MLFERSEFIFYDGAMGTMLHKSGIKVERPDVLCVTAPEVVENVHRLYVEAGSDIICTNTFGANADTLKGSGYSPERIITAAVAIARAASGGTAKVALDIGPTGQLLEPMGDLDVQRAYELFKEQAIAGEQAGADFAAIETMSDIGEMKAAISAVRENTNLPVLATMSFDKTGSTFMGCTPEILAQVAEQLGVSAVGLNCSLAPVEMYETVQRISKATSLPIIVKPNAGLPDGVTGAYDMTPAEFAKQMKQIAQMGAKILGGCCGTTPDYIRALRKAVSGV